MGVTVANISGSGGGGGTPGGSNTQVQFNDSGAFGGDAAFVFDKTKPQVTLTSVDSIETVLRVFAVSASAPLGITVNADAIPSGPAGTIAIALETSAGNSGTDNLTLLQAINVTPNYNNEGSGGTVSVNDGIYIDNQGDVGAVNHALRIADQAAGSTNFAIKTGAGRVSFGDDVFLANGKAVRGIGELDFVSASGASGNDPGSPLQIIAGDGSGSGAGGTIYLTAGGSGSGTPGDIILSSSNFIQLAGPVLFPGNGAIHTGTTDANSLVLRAYDVDGASYKTALTLMSANAPSLEITNANGVAVTVQATTYKSSDGTSGVSAGPFTVISSITVKDGLVTALTGS